MATANALAAAKKSTQQHQYHHHSEKTEACYWISWRTESKRFVLWSAGFALASYVVTNISCRCAYKRNTTDRSVRSINQSINCYFFVHLNVDQRAGQLSLLHVGITKTDGKMKSSKSACWVICPTSGTDILFVGHQPSTSWSCTTMDMGSVCRTVDGVAQG